MEQEKQQHPESQMTNTCIWKLPDSELAKIVSRTSPWDACRASAISWRFKAVAEADQVWDKFLPSDHLDILARSDSPVSYATKKQLYFSLCNSHILLDAAKLSFMLNKWGGEKCYMVSARELSIAWIKSPHWKWTSSQESRLWTSSQESRFSQVAELLCVCWLEIRGKLATKMLPNKTTYVPYLVFKTTENCFGFDYAIEASVNFVGQEKEGETSSVHLVPPGTTYVEGGHNLGFIERQVPQENARLPQKRRDGWMEVELGESYNEGDDDGREVEAALFETRVQNWKNGLLVEGIEFRPKG